MKEEKDDVLGLLDDLTALAAGAGAVRIEVETADFALAVTGDAEPLSGAVPAATRPARRASPERPSAQRVNASTVGIFSSAKDWAAGEAVKRGAVLGQIQSLGHMAEVTAPVDGEIAEILVAGGAPVEYGQALFAIAPKDQPR